MQNNQAANERNARCRIAVIIRRAILFAAVVLPFSPSAAVPFYCIQSSIYSLQIQTAISVVSTHHGFQQQKQPPILLLHLCLALLLHFVLFFQWHRAGR